MLRKMKETRGSGGTASGGGAGEGTRITREPPVSSLGGLILPHKPSLWLVLLLALLSWKSHPQRLNW